MMESGLNIFVVLIHLSDVDICETLNKLGNATDNGENFSGDLCGTNFAWAWRNHCDLFGLGQRSSDFGGNLKILND